MDLQMEINSLKQRISELEKQAKQEREFPQYNDTYYNIESNGRVDWFKWGEGDYDLEAQGIGNIFRTEEQAEFAAEKLKVEAELRKFSKPFVDDNDNYFIEINSYYKYLAVHSNDSYRTQGTIYFESIEIANEAIDAIGADRIKKYIFGVED